MKAIAKRAQIKRPILHHIIIIGYFIAPFFNLAAYLLSQKSRYPVSLLIKNFFNSFEIFGGILILTMPLIAVSLYFVHRFSFYIFIGHGILVVSDNFYKVFKSNFEPYQILLLGGSLLLLSVVFYIIRRDFRSPYFQVLPRSFREKTRIPISHQITINERKYPITDISETGCFVSESPGHFAIGDLLNIRFSASELEFTTDARLVRSEENGFGLRFVHLPKEVKKKIKNYFTNRFALRIRCNFVTQMQLGGTSFGGKLRDISKSGGFFSADNSNQYHEIIELLKKNQNSEEYAAKLEIQQEKKNIITYAKIVWLHDGTEFNKPAGIGLAFKPDSLKEIKKLYNDLLKNGEFTR